MRYNGKMIAAAPDGGTGLKTSSRQINAAGLP
jgi:hypothetical protein